MNAGICFPPLQLYTSTEGNPGLPSVRISRPCGCAAQRTQTLPSERGMENPGFPMSQLRLGAAGTPAVGRWGTPVSQSPNRGWERLAPPPAGAWGTPGSPYVHISRLCGCAAQRQDEHGFFLGGLRPPKPSRGRVVSWEGRPLPGSPPLGEGTGRLPAGRGGKPGFPVCLHQNRKSGL